MNSFFKQPREIFEKAEFFAGHFFRTVYQGFPKPPNFVVTFLRDPVAHYISLFNHIKYDTTFTRTIRLTADQALAAEIQQWAEEKSIEDWLESDYSTLYSNFQTRYLVRGIEGERPHCPIPRCCP